MVSKGLAKKINILCLLAAIIAVLVLPLKKEVWYDETVSILCSKGIGHNTSSDLANTSVVSSSVLEQLNNPTEVFKATVVDNSNSYLYNILLHWFTAMAGNSTESYMLFSKICGAALLIAFFVLCNLFFQGSIFTSLAILLLTTDNTILGMSHEIRAYIMGAFFVTMAAIWLYKFLYEKDKPVYLLLTGLFSVGAVLSHFLSVYVVLAFIVALLYNKRAALFSFKNLLALLLPVALIAIFLYCSLSGLHVMSKQNEQIKLKEHDFNTIEVLWRALKFTDINFRFVLPAIKSNKAVVALSFLSLLSLYLFGLRKTTDSADRRNLNLLLLLGISGTFFLTFLCFKSQHYTALYFRYFSFCIPFSCLFIAYLLSILFRDGAIKPAVKSIILAAVLFPAAFVSFMAAYKASPVVKYNHAAVANKIQKDKIQKIEVPAWEDALLIHSLLPTGYPIDYTRNRNVTYFTLFNGAIPEKIEVIRNNS